MVFIPGRSHHVQHGKEAHVKSALCQRNNKCQARAKCLKIALRRGCESAL